MVVINEEHHDRILPVLRKTFGDRKIIGVEVGVAAGKTRKA